MLRLDFLSLVRASPVTAFLTVTLPQIRISVFSGMLFAFVTSFDEVVVTIFTSGAQQTLPIWIFATLARPAELPIVNVVARA